MCVYYPGSCLCCTKYVHDHYSFEQEEADLPYEEEILRNPYSVKCWLRYIEHKKDAPKNVVNMVYERALKELPGRWVTPPITLQRNVY